MHAIAYTDASKVFFKSSVAWRDWRCEIRTRRCRGQEEDEGVTEVAPLIAWLRCPFPNHGTQLIEYHSSKPVTQLVSVPWPMRPVPWEVLKMHSKASVMGILAVLGTKKSLQNWVK